MKSRHYKWILYGITLVIIATIVIQIFWNYTNYKANKQQLINDVQLSLDKAVDDYYTQLAKNSTLGLTLDEGIHPNALDDGGVFDQIARKVDSQKGGLTSFDSIQFKDIEGISVFRDEKADSLLTEMQRNSISVDSFKSRVSKLKDSLTIDQPPKLDLVKIVISISNDSLQLENVDNLFSETLKNKAINISYDLKYFSKKDREVYFNEYNGWPEDILKDSINDVLSARSKSRFLPKDSVLWVNFSNTTKTLFNRIIGGLLISIILVIAVISTLFYLLHIIKSQKQMAEIKNDLISNITHEFKTPIATIGVALEGMQSFNVLDDKEKTKSYLQTSSQHLGKLNLMVEKLLETASLDSSSLDLDLEKEDLVLLVKQITDRFKSQVSEKTIEFHSEAAHFIKAIDLFHFENALNNILDNAFKYGGDEIRIFLIAKGTELTIKIEDNGPGIPKEHQKLIFNKFYRIPKGNRHDVKGFGIGLYYSKTIIERHGGNIKLESRPGKTTFKITLNHVDD